VIRVTYKGSHNFDFDARLEAVAERPRSDSGMDFESMTRHMDFEFSNGQQEKLFAAAVKSQFPDFEVLSCE
jgi:hypothetical protein